MGKTLHLLEDEFGSILVSQRGDKRILSFDGGLEQSSVLMSKPCYLSHEYTQIMLLGLVFSEARHISLLGLGGGGLAHCLNYYFPQVTTQVVEIRQAVIDVAYQWFDLPRQPNLLVSCANAFEYMADAQAKSTDLILSDLYEAETMSGVQLQLDFIESCYRALSEQGWLVLNFHELPEEGSALMGKITELFADIRICDVYRGNWVMFCGKAAAVFEAVELKHRAKALAKQVEMPLMYYFKQLRAVK